MAETQWDHWAKGTGCPFCGTRDKSNDYWDFIEKLNVFSLYLSGNQTYRGHCLLILDIRHVSRPDQLPLEEWTAFCADLYRAETVLMQELRPDHINVEIMGNKVPHLHWQIVPRYRSDPRWEAPVWTTTMAEMRVTHLPASERAALVQKLQNRFSAKP